jgi:hypothetical protein
MDDYMESPQLSGSCPNSPTIKRRENKIHHLKKMNKNIKEQFPTLGEYWVGFLSYLPI